MLFITLLPVANVTAEENKTDQSLAAEKEDENTSLSNTPPSLEEKSARRDVAVYFRQCYSNVPKVTTTDENIDQNQLPIGISAAGLRGLNGEIIYEGDVSLEQGDKTLTADRLKYNRSSEQASATGNALFVNGQITLHADQIETNLKTDESSLYTTQYQFHGQGGRGDADLIHDNGKDVYELTESSYTACPPEDTTWSIESSTMVIDNVEEMGSAYNAVLKLKDVPVFYFPYISYPLTDRRKTGFLFPSYKMSSINGITVSQPLYINITNNQDATLTPTYMQDRGTLLATEYRYLFGIGEGKAHFEYLSDDKIRDEDRYLVHFEHNIDFADGWNFNADYNEVSDDYYFADIDTDYGSQSDDQLLQSAKLSYSATNWNSEIEVRDFQVLGENVEASHIVMPKVAFSAYQPLGWESLQFDWYSEITRFDHRDSELYTGTRLHVEPKLSLPLYYNSIFVDTELKYMLTHYEQEIKDFSTLEESETRYIPSFKVHSGINLERDVDFMGSGYRQTLVPQIQYLYVPYQDQSAIGLYDTTLLQQDYYGLFRDNRYSGYDRIADANQITLGISSSFLNHKGQEKLRFAIGQNYYLSQSKTTLTSDNDTDEEISRSSLIGEFDVNFENDYFLHAGLEWNSDNNIIERANTTLEKRWAYNTFMQLSYRYYKQAEDAEWYDVVNQIGSKVNWSINTQWTTFASYYYDVEYNNTFETIVGIKYQSCCWAFGLTYDEHMLPNLLTQDNIDTERSIGVTIELMGLGGVGEATSDQGLFDYGRPFYLK